MAEARPAAPGTPSATWCWHQRQSAPCRVVDRQDMWGETVYRVWLPAKDAVVRARSTELSALESVRAVGRSHPAYRGGGQAARRAGGQPAARADPVQRRSAAAPALRAEPRDEPAPDSLPAGRRGGPGQDDRGRADPARTEAARHGAPHPGGGAQGAGAPVAGRDAPALRREAAVHRPGGAGRLPAVAQRRREPLAAARPGDLLAGLGQADRGPAGLEPGAAEQLQPRALRGPDLGVVGPGHHRRVAPHGRQHRSGGALQAGRCAGRSGTLPAAAVGDAAPGQDRPVPASDAAGRPGLVPRRRQRHARIGCGPSSSAPRSASRSTRRASRCSSRA